MQLAGIGAMGDFWKVVREFNPEGIEREATSPLDLWILGEPDSGRHTLARSLLGADVSPELGRVFNLFDMGETPDPLPYSEKPDLLIFVTPLDRDHGELGREASAIISRLRVPALLVLTHADTVRVTRDVRNSIFRTFSAVSYMRTVFVDARDRAEVQAKILPLMLDAIPNLRTPIARQLPAARTAVADQIIAETARVNAQFALVANLPANLPLLGGVAGSVADFFVLTKNQVMMVLRLAAIYGRDVSMTRSLMAEIAPVVGNAFMWRSAARMAVGMLPTFVAAVPKAGIAYAGTYTVGQAAKFYYEHGRKPPRDLMKRFTEEGNRLYMRTTRRNLESPRSDETTP